MSKEDNKKGGIFEEKLYRALIPGTVFLITTVLLFFLTSGKSLSKFAECATGKTTSDSILAIFGGTLIVITVGYLLTEMVWPPMRLWLRNRISKTVTGAVMGIPKEDRNEEERYAAVSLFSHGYLSHANPKLCEHLMRSFSHIVIAFSSALALIFAILSYLVFAIPNSYFHPSPPVVAVLAAYILLIGFLGASGYLEVNYLHTLIGILTNPHNAGALTLLDIEIIPPRSKTANNCPNNSE